MNKQPSSDPLKYFLHKNKACCKQVLDIIITESFTTSIYLNLLLLPTLLGAVVTYREVKAEDL